MKTVLVVTADDDLRTRLLRPLGERSVFTVTTDDEAARTLQLTEVDLIIKDATTAPRELIDFAARARGLSPSAIIVGIGDDEAVAEDVDFGLPRRFTQRELALTLRQAEEKHRLLHEVAALRLHPPAPVARTDDPVGRGDVSAPALEQTLKEFAKALAAGFDLPRMLEQFLDAVGEMVRPSRSALLVADPAKREYRVRAQRGLAPQIVERVRLGWDAGLPRWLTAQGRPLQAEEAPGPDPALRDVRRELALVHAVVAIPLIAGGELVAILTLGQRIVGGAYLRRETEILFMLATQFATAIHDIRLHHQLQQEKEYNERILAHMSSGVVTIGRDQRISTVNRRAEEILQLPVRDLVGRDLRVLPSPLGDLLFETLSRGRALPRTEMQLAFRNLPLELSTYPIMGDEPRPLGAVLVFEDLSAQKALVAEKRQADQFQLLTRVVARISDEIKNPLVSISTLMELLEERYDDPDFRHHFATVVRRDVRRVVQVFEKLTALVSERELNFEVVDVRALVDEMLVALGAAAVTSDANGVTVMELTDETLGRTMRLHVYEEPTPQSVKADRLQLKRALSYLVWYLMHKSPGDQCKVSISVGPEAAERGEQSIRLLIASRTAEVGAEELGRMFDPMEAVQDSLIDVGPAVSQRLIEAQGGQLQVRQARHEVSFLVTLPGTTK